MKHVLQSGYDVMKHSVTVSTGL